MEIQVLDEATVERLLEPRELLDALADGFLALHRGEVVAPARTEVAVPMGFSLTMPVHRSGGRIAVKIVNVFEGNPQVGLPSHLALICVFDASTGACVAVLDGTAITAWRTSAAAVLSAELLAREDAAVLTIVGAGVQGRGHLRLMPEVRELREIRIASLRFEEAERLAALDPRAVAVESVEEAVASSDIVSLCSHSGSAVIDPAWVAPGTHVTSVGYREPDGELPPALLDRARLFVETRLAFEPTPVGCYELQGRDASEAVELGELIAGVKPGRGAADEVTVYKAMGHAIEDHVAAELVLRRAAEGATQTVTI